MCNQQRKIWENIHFFHDESQPPVMNEKISEDEEENIDDSDEGEEKGKVELESFSPAVKRKSKQNLQSPTLSKQKINSNTLMNAELDAMKCFTQALKSKEKVEKVAKQDDEDAGRPFWESDRSRN